MRITRRTRNRKAGDFTPAELEWLTGETQQGANRFTLLMLRYLNDQKHIEQCESLLERETFLPAARKAKLRREVVEAREQFERYQRARNSL